MALIKCPECGKEISDRATNCIHCGCPIEKKEVKKTIICPECGCFIEGNVDKCPNCACPSSKFVISISNENNTKVTSISTNEKDTENWTLISKTRVYLKAHPNIIVYLLSVALPFCVWLWFRFGNEKQAIIDTIKPEITKELKDMGADDITIKDIVLVKESENVYTGVVTIKEEDGTYKYDITVTSDRDTYKWEMPETPLSRKAIEDIQNSIDQLDF